MRTPRTRQGRPGSLWLAWLVLAAGLVLVRAGNVVAHGGPERVIDRRYVVTLALDPKGENTALRFALSDLRTGRALAEPVTLRVHIRADGSTGWLVRDLGGQTTTGRVDVQYPLPRPGSYEVFLELDDPHQPGRVHRPEDWLVALPDAREARLWAWVLPLGAVTAAGAVWWFRPAARTIRAGEAQTEER